MSDENPYEGMLDAINNSASWVGSNPEAGALTLEKMRAFYHEITVERPKRERAILDELTEARKDPDFRRRQDVEHCAMMERGLQPNPFTPHIVTKAQHDAIMKRADEIEADLKKGIQWEPEF